MLHIRGNRTRILLILVSMSVDLLCKVKNKLVNGYFGNFNGFFVYRLVGKSDSLRNKNAWSKSLSMFT